MFLSSKIKNSSPKYSNGKLGISSGEESNYLKGYFLLVLKFCKKYNITKMQLEIMFYFYKEGSFTINDLTDLGFGEKVRRYHLYNLRDNHLIVCTKQYNASINEPKRWGLNRKGKMLVRRFYRILENVEDINSDYEEFY